jgi:hypothetical protein
MQLHFTHISPVKETTLSPLKTHQAHINITPLTAAVSEPHNDNLCLQNNTHEAGSNLFQISVIVNKKQYSLM